MSKAEQAIPKAVVLGLSGQELTGREQRFFAAADPYGFILFARNCKSPVQVKRLVAELRDTVGRSDAPVLIDQEGGRVARLKPPHWRAAAPAADFGVLAQRDPDLAGRAVRLNARAIAVELAALGIDVDCAPVLDVPVPGSHDIIGDRAFAREPDTVSRLGRAAIEGFLDGGVLPVIKHIPGHGRAAVDSHQAMPRVSAGVADLRDTDFAPFRALADAPWAMTAHVVYEAIDPDRPATVSAKVIGEIVRGEIAFDGVLISDDLSMQALAGGLGERAGGAIAAGCDLALHCNGDMAEMAAVAEAVGPMTERALDRAARAMAMLKPPETVDLSDLVSQLATLMQTT